MNMADAHPENDDLLWSHPVAFDNAFKGLDLSLEADEARRARVQAAFGMIDLISLKVTVHTHGKPSHDHTETVHIRVELSGEVTQECGATLEPFTHEISSRLEVDCVKAETYSKSAQATGEQELSANDLDEPDLIENGRIDLGLYIIEALGEAYDPFARKPGAIFEEPAAEPEPSPFAALSRLKFD
ncbi:DUF177 domain-containing protein [Asticcacaulis sp. SL142]|uniref:YceD family protein n=1 Tax=Asticcacaulis sp. SL142 TaxID=2995155 RepID=UPI00226D35A7|nr:DUF177 domain-containing protein [Asticcacaulis sp. SL142]WAC48811.1 DUF177 domain-containing protein [Asticcacaulis sp. SL142]